MQENLKIAGHLVEVVEFAHETFHNFDTYQKLQDGFVAQDKRQEVLTLMRGLARYGSEVGRPCDGLWCCDGLTDDIAANEPS